MGQYMVIAPLYASISSEDIFFYIDRTPTTIAISVVLTMFLAQEKIILY
jgi:hypothetical protein